MKRSKFFWSILWFSVTGGSMLFGFISGQFKRSFQKSNITLVTEFPDLIPPGFQIYMYEKFQIKVQVEKSRFNLNSQDLQLASLDSLPKIQLNTEKTIKPDRISTEFISLIQLYPQFIPLFWKIEGQSPKLKLITIGLWIPEEFKNQSFNDLISDESLQEWLNQTQINTALSNLKFSYNDIRSAAQLKNYSLSELEFLKPQ